jgi:hypothetical protein
MNARLLAVAGAGVAAVVVIAAVVLLASGGGGGALSPLPPPNATTIAANGLKRDTTVSLLGSGSSKNRDTVDIRYFDIIANGINWNELQPALFPTSEVEIVLVYPDKEATSVGLMTNRANPELVESLWRDVGQPDRKRLIYVAPVGELANVEVERWLREKLTSIGFQITTDISKARERLLFTVTR